MPESQQARSGIINAVSTWLQLLALIVLAAEGILVLALANAPESERLWYVPMMLGFLGVIVVGLFFDRYMQQRFRTLPPAQEDALPDTTSPNVISPSPGRTLRIELAESLSVGSPRLRALPADKIIPLIKHQLHVHRFVFSYPNPSAYIPIEGRCFGRFSWDERVITCHELFEISSDVDNDYWYTWSSMQSQYVEAYSAPHRQPGGQPTEQSLEHLRASLASIATQGRKLVESGNRPEGQVVAALTAKLTVLLESVNLSDRSNTPRNAVVQLEMGLSTAHDLIRRLTPKAVAT